MAHLIDKDALIAEIERMKDEYFKYCKNIFHAEWSCWTLDNILSFIATLEVKEPTNVFIEKACDWLRGYINPTAGTYLLDEDIEKFRKAMKGE